MITYIQFATFTAFAFSTSNTLPGAVAKWKIHKLTDKPEEMKVKNQERILYNNDFSLSLEDKFTLNRTNTSDNIVTCDANVKPSRTPIPDIIPWKKSLGSTFPPEWITNTFFNY